VNGTPRFTVPRRWPQAGLALFALAALAAVFGLMRSPVRAWSNLLLCEVYILCLALAGALFISIQHLSGAGWSAVLRRVAEAMMSGLPAAAVLLLPLLLGRHVLYPPSASHHAEDHARAAFLSLPFVALRTVAVLAAWVWLARALRRASLHQDEARAASDHHRLVKYSAVFVVVFAVTLSLAGLDWLMALDPDWSSTVFAVYVFAGLMVSGVAALTLIVILLQRSGHLRGVVGAAHLHDLGKLLLTFTTFWAYIWLSQYLLIWYGDLPEEVTYYARRTAGPWTAPFLLNLVVNWAVPFLVLLPRAAKRSPQVLAGVCVLLLFGHWLDLYMLIMPETLAAPALGPLEVLLPAGYAGLFAYLTARALAQAPLVPLGDPRLEESLRHET
jgi:hypothetical protein